ncbi:hypothetical protein ES702_01891 [subsurface metagenome]
MPIGNNIALRDKLIKKTAGKVSKTSKRNITSKTGATSNTVKMTFYVKQELLERLYNFAYWDRHSITDAFNVALRDGLKGKNTKPRK